MIECFQYVCFSDSLVDFLLRHSEYFDLFEDAELLIVGVDDEVAFSVGTLT